MDNIFIIDNDSFHIIDIEKQDLDLFGNTDYIEKWEKDLLEPIEPDFYNEGEYIEKINNDYSPYKPLKF
jgi:hypothetical protein